MADRRGTLRYDSRTRRGIRRRSAIALVVRVVLLAAIVLGGGELAARIVAPGGAAAAHAERRALLERIPGAAAGTGEHDPEALAFQASSAGFQLHPFFGYTATRGANGANNQGFFAGDASYPYRKAPDEFVIALFGGSVAGQLNGVKNLLLDPLTPALRARGFTKVTLISFALGGWRQPQSFFALVYFLPTFDMAVTLDGFNEVIHTGEDELAVFPASFPFSSIYGPLAHRAGSAEKTLRTAELIQRNRSMASWTRALDKGPLHDSVLAHLVWRVAAARYERRANELRTEAQAEVLDEWRDMEPPPGGDFAAKRRDYLRFYEDLIADSSGLSRAHGKLFFHFVQPNQYDRDSKPLSGEERAERVVNESWFDLVTPQYRELGAIAARLQARGVHSDDLSGVFAGHDETVYADSCCHLNEHGLEILTQAMADRILASGELDAVTPAAR